MAKKTKIQWCDSTCNPTMGCEGCELWNHTTKKCYAGILHQRFGGKSKGYALTFEGVTQFPGRMLQATQWSDLSGTDRKDKPWLNGYPRLIFVSDMSDSLSSTVSFEYLHDEIITNVDSVAGRRHQWLWLTKRPNRMAEFSSWLAERDISWPTNVWAGTSITSQQSTTRIDHLLNVGDASTIRFLSVEPQYEEIDLTGWLPRLDWVIQGGESGHGATTFQVEWAQSLIEQCRQFGVPYFLKQLGTVVTENGERLEFQDNHAGDWSEWPEGIRVREFPDLTGSESGHDEEEPREPLGILSDAEKRHQAALKAWRTRRARQADSAVDENNNAAD